MEVTNRRYAPGRSIDRTAWRPALLHALPVTVMLVGLVWYWFAIADRHIVFLYYHDMGPLVPDTSPFSFVTRSRYWMTGLVASGAVMVLYAAANWLLARFGGQYRPPAWWRVWTLCAGPLLIGIPAITMTVNEPTLPAVNAAQTTVATLMGLVLALMPGRMAAERPSELIWLACDGWGLMMVLLNSIALERVGGWLARGRVSYVRWMVVGLAFGAGLLLVMTGLRVWRRTCIPTAAAVFMAGLCVAYPLMALAHHVSFTDHYYYISGRDNFFARSGALQIGAWLIAATLALAVTRLREHLNARRMLAETYTA